MHLCAVIWYHKSTGQRAAVIIARTAGMTYHLQNMCQYE